MKILLGIILKVHVLHYANELLLRIRLSFLKLLQTRSTGRNNEKKNVWEKSNDAYSASIRVQTTIIQISICFSPQYQSASWKRHCVTPWREQRGWALFENGKLVNQIARLAAIEVKLNTPLFRYFYNHLSNYTKTIICLRLVNIIHLMYGPGGNG